MGLRQQGFGAFRRGEGPLFLYLSDKGQEAFKPKPTTAQTTAHQDEGVFVASPDNP